jgi:hypothetical protein
VRKEILKKNERYEKEPKMPKIKKKFIIEVCNA